MTTYQEKYQTVTGNVLNKNQEEQLNCEYLQQAIDFLFETNTKISITKAYQAVPEWDKENINAGPVNVYLVLFKNDKHAYEFTFYSSIADTYGPEPRKGEDHITFHKRQQKHQVEQRRKIRIYDVLACLNVDYSEDFHDFCENFGLSTDSRKSLNTYEAVRTETRNIKKLWPSKEDQDKLNEIS